MYINSNLIPGAILGRIRENLEVGYKKPARCYHTIEHAIDVLTNVEDAHQHVGLKRPVETALAALYHDVVYMPGAKTNELESMQVAMRDLARFHEIVDIGRIAYLIWLTSLHFKIDDSELEGDEDAKMFLDCDIFGFSKPWDIFSKNNEALDIEFKSVMDAKTYSQGRLAFIDNLARQEHLFHSKWFRTHFGIEARNNIARYLGDLRRNAGLT